MSRVGMGFDAHMFGEGDEVVLGGVRIPHHSGLSGHSDGDVVAHAVADAILGAAGLGDIGMHFPASPEWAGRSSLDMLEVVAQLVTQAGWRIGNVDVTVIAAAPRVSEHGDAMREKMGSALRVDPGAVSVKATTTDGMGFTGRGEGIAALAVALLSRPDVPR